MNATTGFDIYDASGVWELLCDVLSIGDASLDQKQVPPFHPWRSAELLIGGVAVGALGEIHPSVAQLFGLHGRVVGCEIDLAELVIDRGAWTYRPPSVFPPAIFDMAFIVHASTPASSLTAVITEAAGDLLEHLSIFDVFTGETIGVGRKSLAVNIRLRAPDRTLTDEDAGVVRRSIAASVTGQLGGELRGEL